MPITVPRIGNAALSAEARFHLLQHIDVLLQPVNMLLHIDDWRAELCGRTQSAARCASFLHRLFSEFPHLCVSATLGRRTAEEKMVPTKPTRTTFALVPRDITSSFNRIQLGRYFPDGRHTNRFGMRIARFGRPRQQQRPQSPIARGENSGGVATPNSFPRCECYFFAVIEFQ